MPLYVTFHDGSLSRGANGESLPLLGRRVANRSSLTVGAVASSSAAPSDCIASISATEDCCVEIGAIGAVSATNSEVFLAGRTDFRVVKEGQFVSVIDL